MSCPLIIMVNSVRKNNGSSENRAKLIHSVCVQTVESSVPNPMVNKTDAGF